MPDAMIRIDGAYGEGGGATIRTALQMACLTTQAFRLFNVRGGSRYPGLDVEDLAILNALADSTAAETEGAEIGSHEIFFRPTRRPTGITGVLPELKNAHGRGPNALIVLNALVPVLTRAGVYSSVTAAGETYGNHSLGFDSFRDATAAAYRKFGVYVFPHLIRAGFGREATGQVDLDIEPSAVGGLDWSDRGKRRVLGARIVTSGIPISIGERAEAHLRRLAHESGLRLEMDRTDVDSANPGCAITVWAEYDRAVGCGSAVGARGLRVESIAQGAFDELQDWMSGDSTLDSYLADQIIVTALMAGTPSILKVSSLSPRLTTAIWVARQFAPIRVTVRGSENGPAQIRIDS